jgi:hypothetical protein
MSIVILSKIVLSNVIKSIVLVSCDIVIVVVGQVTKASTPKSLRFCVPNRPCKCDLSLVNFLLKMHLELIRVPNLPSGIFRSHHTPLIF